MRHKLTLTATCLLTCLAGYANAQQPVPRDVQELRRDQLLNEAGRSPIPELPRPRHADQQAKLYETRYPFVCMGIDPWQPVYSKPDYASQVPNWLTQSAVAVTGNPINGFLQILFYNGNAAFVPAASIHTYRGINNPAATCTFAGKDERGRPMFSYNVPPTKRRP